MSESHGTPRQSWLEEKRSAYIYAVLADLERGTPREKMFRKLGEYAECQSELWRRKVLEAEGQGAVLEFDAGARAKFVLSLTRFFGPRAMRSVLAALKVRGLSAYSSAGVVLTKGHAIPSSISEVGQRHQIKGAGGNIRAAVFGINDGLVSNAALILGVSAASSMDPKVVVLSGTTALFAGALSMASGEYVSVKSQRELLEYQLELERAELEEYPEEEAAELALIYTARGIPEDQAREVANRLIADPDRALNTLAREELGLDPEDLASPWGAAVSSFLSFVVGGILPLVPFLLYSGSQVLWISMGLTGCALFLTGAIVSLFSGRSLLWSGVRMLLIGGGAGLISYWIGKAVS